MSRPRNIRTSPKDPRYDLVPVMLKNGRIKTFLDIFAFVPASVVQRDIGMNHGKWKRIMERPEKLSLLHVDRMADLMGIKVEILAKLVVGFIKERGRLILENKSK